MLFKEKLLLSNCDSTRKLNATEIRKRFMTGLTFADGVIITPNTLIDNVNIHEIITKKNVVKYLNEEGFGKFIIRVFNLQGDFFLSEYFANMPDDFIFSSFDNTPKKSELSPEQLTKVRLRLEAIQEALNEISPVIESVSVHADSLKNEVFSRIKDEDSIKLFRSQEERQQFLIDAKSASSRSQWYKMSDNYFSAQGYIDSAQFKSEVIDPAYNSLFAFKGEGFLQDNIKVINDVPEQMLEVGVVLKSLRREIKFVEYPLKAFKLIANLGTEEILKCITDEALNYIEDKLKEKGETYLTRKNWYGMYRLMSNKIGLEIK